MTKPGRNKRLSIAKKGCFGKVKHKSMLAAEYVLSRMKGPDSHKLEIYRCRFCKWFHIGHNNQKEDIQLKKENEENEKKTLSSDTK